MGSGNDKSSDKRKKALFKTYLKLRRKFIGKSPRSAQQITLPGKGGGSPSTPPNRNLPITESSPLSNNSKYSDEQRATKREREDDKQTNANSSKKQEIYNIFHTKVNDAVAAAGVSPRTPPNRTLAITHSEETPSSSIYSKSGGRVVQHFGNNAIANGGGELLTFEGGTGVNVSVDLCDGEYVLKIKKRKISSSTDENDTVERPEQIAQSAGMLLLHAELIREMGEQLLAQYRASLRSIFIDSATAS